MADLLDQSNATATVNALDSLATCMARLVAGTAGQEEAFTQLRATLPGGAGLGRCHEATRWLEETCDRVARWADVLAIPMPNHFDAACARIAALYADPGPYLAFSHGDPAPSNNHIGPRRACLVDFEYAGYRHALYDLTGWAILCPLPWAWVAAMEQAFQRALAAAAWGGPLADDGRYREAWATMCAYRALAMITWLSLDLLAEDRAWAVGWTGRAALISATLRLHQAGAGVAALTPLADLGGRMCEELQARWPTLGEGAPRWPAAVGVPSP
jgi:Ser/Thr protein kinase RdoA (MazF antagonist)